MWNITLFFLSFAKQIQLQCDSFFLQSGTISTPSIQLGTKEASKKHWRLFRHSIHHFPMASDALMVREFTVGAGQHCPDAPGEWSIVYVLGVCVCSTVLVVCSSSATTRKSSAVHIERVTYAESKLCVPASFALRSAAVVAAAAEADGEGVSSESSWALFCLMHALPVFLICFGVSVH